MALPAPQFVMVHAVLGFASPVFSHGGRDDLFIQSVRPEFPQVMHRQQLPAEAPPPTPFLVLASTSSQLALSRAQADFEVRFYGDYLDDIERGVEYVERKLLTLLDGLNAVEIDTMTIGVVGTLNFPFNDADVEASGAAARAHILNTLLKTDVEPDHVQDAMAKLAIRVRDTYFVNLSVSNYESRVLERPVLPGMSYAIIRPWDGKLQETGIALTIDINNILEMRGSSDSEPPRVTSHGLRALTRLLREVAMKAGPKFVESGSVSVEDMVEVSVIQ